MLGAFMCYEPCVYCLGIEIIVRGTTRHEEDLQVATEATLPEGECHLGEETGGQVHLSVPGTPGTVSWEKGEQPAQVTSFFLP